MFRSFVRVFSFWVRDPTADRRRVSRPGASRDTKNAFFRVSSPLDVSAEIAIAETSPENRRVTDAESYASRRSARIVSAAAAASSKTRRFAKSDKRLVSACVEASLSTYASTPFRSASIRSTGGSSGFPRRSTTRPPAPPTARVAPRHGGRRVSRLFAARRRRKPTTRLAFASAAAAAARSASSNLRRAFSFSRALRARRRLRSASPEASVSPASAGDGAGAAPEGGVPSRVPPPPASCARSAAAREKSVITCLARSSPSRFASCAARARSGPPARSRGISAMALSATLRSTSDPQPTRGATSRSALDEQSNISSAAAHFKPRGKRRRRLSSTRTTRSEGCCAPPNASGRNAIEFEPRSNVSSEIANETPSGHFVRRHRRARTVFKSSCASPSASGNDDKKTHPSAMSSRNVFTTTKSFGSVRSDAFDETSRCSSARAPARLGSVARRFERATSFFKKNNPPRLAGNATSLFAEASIVSSNGQVSPRFSGRQLSLFLETSRNVNAKNEFRLGRLGPSPRRSKRSSLKPRRALKGLSFANQVCVSERVRR